MQWGKVSQTPRGQRPHQIKDHKVWLPGHFPGDQVTQPRAFARNSFKGLLKSSSLPGWSPVLQDLVRKEGPVVVVGGSQGKRERMRCSLQK